MKLSNDLSSRHANQNIVRPFIKSRDRASFRYGWGGGGEHYSQLSFRSGNNGVEERAIPPPPPPPRWWRFDPPVFKRFRHKASQGERERDDSPPGVAVRRPLNSPLLARPSISTVRVIKSERSILQRCDTPCVQRHEEVGKAWAKKANALERARESRREHRRVCVCVCSRNVDGGRRGKVRMTEARGTETARHGGAFGGRKGMEKWRRRKKKRERGMGREGERDSGKEWNAVRGGRWR